MVKLNLIILNNTHSGNTEATR